MKIPNREKRTLLRPLRLRQKLLPCSSFLRHPFILWTLSIILGANFPVFILVAIIAILSPLCLVEKYPARLAFGFALRNILVITRCVMRIKTFWCLTFLIVYFGGGHHQRNPLSSLLPDLLTRRFFISVLLAWTGKKRKVSELMYREMKQGATFLHPLTVCHWAENALYLKFSFATVMSLKNTCGWVNYPYLTSLISVTTLIVKDTARFRFFGKILFAIVAFRLWKKKNLQGISKAARAGRKSELWTRVGGGFFFVLETGLTAKASF